MRMAAAVGVKSASRIRRYTDSGGSMRARRKIVVLAAAIVVVMSIGTLGFHVLEGTSLFDSFYLVLTTFTTIGYQGPATHAGRVFNMLPDYYRAWAWSSCCSGR